MSKRNSSTSLEDEFNRLFKKMKKLEKKIRVRENATISQPELSMSDPGEGPSSRPPEASIGCASPSPPPPSPSDTSEHNVLDLINDEVLDDEPPAAGNNMPLQEQGPGETLCTQQNDDDENITYLEPSAQPTLDTPPKAIDNTSNADVHGTTQSTELDEDVLEILGDDPTSIVKYGPEIRNELASRFQHITTQGLPREDRKKLIEKYLVPANCLNVGAPAINPEIKAALTENIIKRDKGIETKQKEMASAISCLTDIISLHLNSKDKNTQTLQKLMDAGRILCDIQHADSVTRRNFILFAVKNDMQEHLKNTKIDTFLFGENLSDTLKSAKAVNKSGADLKVPEATKNLMKKAKPQVTQPLNRKAAAPTRRPAGAAPAPRGRAAATAPRAHYPAHYPAPLQPPPPAPAYRTSLTQPPAQTQHPRRRY